MIVNRNKWREMEWQWGTRVFLRDLFLNKIKAFPRSNSSLHDLKLSEMENGSVMLFMSPFCRRHEATQKNPFFRVHGGVVSIITQRDDRNIIFAMITQNFLILHSVFKSRLILPLFVCAKIWSLVLQTQLIDDNDYARFIQKVANGEEK